MAKAQSKTKKEGKRKIDRQFSSGGVVFRSSKRGPLWLVAKSSPSEEFPNEVWRLPKGWIDDTDGGKSPGPIARGDRKANQNDLKSSATREVAEEGGVEAKIVKKIGTEQYFVTFEGRKVMKFATFFLMKWTKDIPEGPGFETAEVTWLPYKLARKKLTHSSEKKILDKAEKLLRSTLRGSLI